MSEPVTLSPDDTQEIAGKVEAQASESREYDAVLLPRGSLSGGPTFADKVAVLKGHRDKFGPGLGADRVYSRDCTSGVLVTASPDDTFLFPTDHPKAGANRYTWSEPDASGVRYVKLVDA